MSVHPSEIIALVVDDRSQMRMIVRTILRSMGFEHIVEANDGDAAYMQLIRRNKTKVQEGKIGLIICDWMMPTMTGAQLLAATRKDATLSKVPFIMVTSEADQESILEAINCGVTDYVTKPFPAKTLEDKVRLVLERMELDEESF